MYFCNMVLQGRTITLKIKNINFEVKTRTVSLPSTVSSEELIFAAARDLLKIEIESVHPQPLRLRLMGNTLFKVPFVLLITP